MAERGMDITARGQELGEMQFFAAQKEYERQELVRQELHTSLYGTLGEEGFEGQDLGRALSSEDPGLQRLSSAIMSMALGHQMNFAGQQAPQGQQGPSGWAQAGQLAPSLIWAGLKIYDTFKGDPSALGDQALIAGGGGGPDMSGGWVDTGDSGVGIRDSP